MICLWQWLRVVLQAVRQLLLFAMSLQILQAAAYFECTVEQRRFACYVILQVSQPGANRAAKREAGLKRAV